MTDFELMGAALDEARKAAALGEVPVGAVVAKAGEPVATMYVNDESRLEEAVKTLRGAIELGAEKPEHEPMVYDVIK